jgi:hypothetical protein
MFYKELQDHFKKYGQDQEIEYFDNTWFLVHKEKYEYMLDNNIDPDNIQEWCDLEELFEAAFLYIQVQAMAEALYKKYDLVTGELEHKLRG